MKANARDGHVRALFFFPYPPGVSICTIVLVQQVHFDFFYFFLARAATLSRLSVAKLLLMQALSYY